MQPRQPNTGRIITLDYGTPVAGANPTALIVPADTIWRLIAATFSIVTSAGGGTRAFWLYAQDALLQWVQFTAASVGQAASLTYRYNVTTSPGPFAAPPTGPVQVALPPEGLWLFPGWRIGFELQSKTGTDAYSQVLAMVEAFGPTYPAGQPQPLAGATLSNDLGIGG